MTEIGLVPPVLFTPDQLGRRVSELGAELSAHYAACERPPVLVGVLKGSSIFLADLARAMNIDVNLDFMSISSYASGEGRSGVVRIVKDLEHDIADRDVLIVEDIVDTGLTLNYLRNALRGRAPRSLEAVTLLDKSVRRIIPVPLEWRGFEIPDVFVLGYGMDHEGIYRNVRGLVAVDDIALLAATPRVFVDGLFFSP